MHDALAMTSVKALAMWQACHTQEEIAEVVGVSIQSISNWQDDFSKSLEAKDFEKSGTFTPPIYNVWKQQEKSNAVSHFGNSEQRYTRRISAHTGNAVLTLA